MFLSFLKRDLKSGRNPVRDWAILLAVLVGVRVLLIATACLAASIRLDQYALLHDGWEYLRMSQAFARFHPRDIEVPDLRLFAGYPAAIALIGFGKFPIFAGLAISILGAAGCALLIGRLGGSRTVAWGLAAFTPSWLLYTSVVMSEGLSTLLILSSLVMTRDRRWGWAGLFAGLAVTVRPVGGFAFIPLMVELLRSRDRRGALQALVAGAPWPLLYMILSRLFWDDPLRSIRDYSHTTRSFAPLESLWIYTMDPGVSLSKKGLVWGSIVLTAAGGVGLWKRWRGGGEDSMRPVFVWQCCAALFYILVPGWWVFGSLDRFLGALWPTTLLGLAPWLPRRRGAAAALVVALGVASWWIALQWLIHLSAVYPFAVRAFEAG